MLIGERSSSCQANGQHNRRACLLSVTCVLHSALPTRWITTSPASLAPTNACILYRSKVSAEMIRDVDHNMQRMNDTCTLECTWDIAYVRLERSTDPHNSRSPLPTHNSCYQQHFSLSLSITWPSTTGPTAAEVPRGHYPGLDSWSCSWVMSAIQRSQHTMHDTRYITVQVPCSMA